MGPILPLVRAGFKTVGAPGQDIFRGDVSCQTGVVDLHCCTFNTCNNV